MKQRQLSRNRPRKSQKERAEKKGKRLSWFITRDARGSLIGGEFIIYETK